MNTSESCKGEYILKPALMAMPFTYLASESVYKLINI